MKIEVDGELADKLLVASLGEHIELLADSICELLLQNSLLQYKIADLKNDRMYLKALITAYNYYSLDTPYDYMLEELC